MAEEVRSEQLAQKITPAARKKLDDTLKRMGFSADGSDGHVKWDQEKLLQMLSIIESTLVLDEHENYAEVVASINQYTSLINSKIISLISDLDNAEARIRSEYEKKLDSKDSLIKDLQEQRSAQEETKKFMQESTAQAKDAQTVAEKQLVDVAEKLKKSEDTVKDKESIIQMLNVKLKEAEDKLAGYDSLKMSEASLKDQVTALLHSKELMEREAQEEKRSAERDLEEQKRASEQAQELAVERAVAKISKEMQDELNKIIEEKRLAERDLEEQKRASEQAQELAVERAVTKTGKELQEELNKLREEKTRLQVQLEMLQKKQGTE